jgi:predicted metal-dependent peptidase
MNTREQLDQLGKRILEASRTELFLSMRFMGSALDSLSYVMDLNTRTAGTDAANIRFNPTFLMQLYIERPRNLNRLYIHMLLHCIFRHMFGSGEHEDAELFDLSADIAVESILDSMEYSAVQTTHSDFRQL